MSKLDRIGIWFAILWLVGLGVVSAVRDGLDVASAFVILVAVYGAWLGFRDNRLWPKEKS